MPANLEPIRRSIARPQPLASALAFSLALALQAGSAAAEDSPSRQHNEKLMCSQSFELAQRLRNDSRYLEANQELLKCSNPSCGDALFQECSKLYAEVQTAIPSVIFQARDSTSDRDLIDVTVTLDGRVLAEQLDGKPVLVDPGNHTFTFSAPNAPPVQKDIVIRAGEKLRQVVVDLDLDSKNEPAVPSDSKPTPVPAHQPSHESRSRHVPAASYVLGTVGVIGLGTFVALRVVGAGDYHSLETNCSPNCAQSQVDGVKQKYLFSNVALGVGAAALAAAIVVYAVQPSRPSQGETALVIGPSPFGVLARAVTRF